ncbi:potassium/sodium hyperpolarization-activated cyclic nucleotide-gated channel 2-like [Zophobas morio]|uniref:potassium/sodium hyperpolarization-activated cyclic nucleotide-gated channel 2-like n=1 Tax=Zophobas morio TaxID=2755281 RepID=UPI00308334BE
MFKTQTYHICSISDDYSESYLPALSVFASPWLKLKRFLKKLILVTEVNPASASFYRRAARIVDERKTQIESNSWIIHPFSTFRLYYEMYMAVVFLFCLIYMPLHASYHFLLGEVFSVFYNILTVLCIVDIVMNFVSGRCVSQEEILMEPKKIAKAYISGPYFICDVLSSVPDHLFGDSDVNDVFTFLSILKLARMVTFFQFLERTFNFFQVKGLTYYIVKLALLLFFICHYTACWIYYSILVYDFLGGYIADNVHVDLRHRDDLKEFFQLYLKNMNYGASFILGIDFIFRYTYPAIFYASGIFTYILGRIVVSFFIVVLMDMFKITNYLEVKYQEVISQVNSYMSAKHFPVSIQSKVRHFYDHRYQGKYLNEQRVEKFISEKLKKEIKYHECRKLIRSVAIFQKLPQEIMENILPYLKKELYMPGDTVISAGTIGECMYFMSTGTVSVVSPSGKEICHLEDGDFFGEICLLVSHAKRTANVTAVESCELYKLEKRYFKKCFEGHAEILHEIQIEAQRRNEQTLQAERQVIKSFATLPVKTDVKIKMHTKLCPDSSRPTESGIFSRQLNLEPRETGPPTFDNSIN